MDRHRVFLAVNFSDEFKRALGGYSAGLVPAYEGLRPVWVDPKLYHLTLHFFGEIDGEALAAIGEELRLRAPRPAAPRIAAGPLEALPAARAARVLCVRLEITPRQALWPLVDTAREIACARGAAGETRPWRPHLSLARFRQPASLREAQLPPSLPPPPELAFFPSGFDLMESFLAPRGPSYKILRSFSFAPQR